MGLGYIGLPTATMFANSGVRVFGVDVRKEAVDTINSGKAHIIEPDLDSAVRSAVVSGNLTADLEPKEAEFYILCVPTPFKEEGDIPEPDISYVLQSADTVAPLLKDGDTIIVESTSPVGTTEAVEKQVRAHVGPDMKLFFAYCPERVLPGKIMSELIHNDRIVGGLSPEGAANASRIYRTFVKAQILETNAQTAEMVKLTENSYRDLNIAFANELSLIADRVNVNVWELIELANHHPRVNILQPGCGVGGHCIAVDPWFIVSMVPDLARLIHTARIVNDGKPDFVINQVQTAAQSFQERNGRKATVACLGLAFKPDVDDFRESPALMITERLNGLPEMEVIAVEPYATEAVSGLKMGDYESTIESADIVVGLVKHSQFAGASIRRPDLIDFCGLKRV